MILVDTSVWIDHLRQSDAQLTALLDEVAVVLHPFVIGEIALGNLQNRKTILTLLQQMPCLLQALDSEVLILIEQAALSGLGIGYVDAHLLASAKLTPGTRIWTRDKRLAHAAEALGLLFTEPRAA